MARTPNVSGIVSLRLTPEERRLVEEAAVRKGWKVAHFLRVSALERAAHVLNLSRPTSFDFSGAAKRLAHVLLAKRDVGLVLNEGFKPLGRLEEGQVFGELDAQVPDEEAWGIVGPYDIQPARLTGEQVEELNQAVRLGGVEFAAELIVECRRRIGVTSDPNLPPPIDPSKLKEQDKE